MGTISVAVRRDKGERPEGIEAEEALKDVLRKIINPEDPVKETAKSVKSVPKKEKFVIPKSKNNTKPSLTP